MIQSHVQLLRVFVLTILGSQSIALLKTINQVLHWLPLYLLAGADVKRKGGGRVEVVLGVSESQIIE